MPSLRVPLRRPLRAASRLLSCLRCRLGVGPLRLAPLWRWRGSYALLETTNVVSNIFLNRLFHILCIFSATSRG